MYEQVAAERDRLWSMPQTQPMSRSRLIAVGGRGGHEPPPVATPNTIPMDEVELPPVSNGPTALRGEALAKALATLTVLPPG